MHFRRVCEAVFQLCSPVCPRLQRVTPPGRLSVPPAACLGARTHARTGWQAPSGWAGIRPPAGVFKCASQVGEPASERTSERARSKLTNERTREAAAFQAKV